MNSTIPFSTSARNNCQPRRMCACFCFGDSCESAMSRCIARQPSPSRLSTFNNMACDTANRDCNRSGGAAMSRA